MNVLLRFVIAASLVVSAIIHAWLYVHGYGHIPVVGAGFLVQASVFLAVGILVLLGGPDWLVLSAGPLAAGALIAFALSRTMGIAGFVERGWEPVPYAVASAVTKLACGGWWFSRRRADLR